MITRSATTRSLTGGYQRVPRGRPAFAGLAAMGRRGDTELAHVNPREAAVLKSMGGSGTINPATGLREYALGGGPGSQSESMGSPRASERNDGFSFGGGGSSGDLFGDASAFRDALASFQGGGNPEMGPGARVHRARIEGAQPTMAHKAVAFGVGTAMPFGIDAAARPDYISGKPTLDVTWSPMQTMANMSPLGPLGDAVAPDLGKTTLASVPFGDPQGAPPRDDGGDKGGDGMQAQIDALVRSVLQRPQAPDTRAEQPAKPAPARRVVPFEGDPYSYGTVGGTPSHAFFAAS